jgi:hypothetical protein
VRDNNLRDIPFLFIFQKGEDRFNELCETLLAEIGEYRNHNILYLNYDVGIEEVYYGLEWLSENMKSL